MKKIMIVFFILLYVFSMKSVYAQDQYKLTLIKQDNIYYYRTGDNVNESLNYYLYKFGEMYAYCLEPGINITTYNYIGIDDFIDLPFSDELKEKIELIGYYGREYPGHDDLKYSMAAQPLIWEEISNTKVSFWTQSYGKGDMIDVTKEKNEIMNLVKNHNVLPKIPSNINCFINEEMIISDVNNVLEYYQITSNNGQKIYIDGNNLHILSDKIGSYTINFKRKNFNEYNTIIFIGKDKSSTQKFGRLHYEKEVQKDITINVSELRLLIRKVDENNDPVSIENIAFKIKNMQTGEYVCQTDNCLFLTNKEGVILTNNLAFGKYEIEEIENQIIEGYTWNKNKINVLINNDSNIKVNSNYSNYIEVLFPNKKVLGNIELIKYGEKAIVNNNEIIYEKEKLSNIKFSLYDEKDNFIKEVVTDDNGIIKYNYLPIGKYYFIENTKLDEYVNNDDKYYFEIKQENQYNDIIDIKLEILNYLKKGTLEFTKTDLVTGEKIANTIIEIYDEKNNLLLTRETDSNGKVVINNLPIGKYYIIEKEANSDYLISDERVFFEIKENNEIVKANMANKKITGTVIVNKKGEEYFIENNEIVYKKNNLDGIKFFLYDDNDKLIDTIITDNNGTVKRDNLELGNYCLIEVNSYSSYIENNNKYCFEVNKKENNENIVVNMEIDNYLKKGTLEFTKTDLVTGEEIANTIIEIYDEKSNLLLTRETDSNGKVIINNLPIGKYYIIEKEPNRNYIITNEKVFFEIRDNNEIVKANMTNERITIPVPKTGKNNLFNLLYLLFLLSIGFCYEKSRVY